MIPGYENNNDDDDRLVNDFEVITAPSLTYAMNILKDRNCNIDETAQQKNRFRFFNGSRNPKLHFIGRFDDTEAVQQAILKILNTERYEYEIYSWDYGIELSDLFGQSMPYVMSEVKQRITDALTADDRIESVDGFEVKKTGKKSLHCTFTVHTVQSDEIQIEGEVSV